MASSTQYIETLVAERDSLDPSYHENTIRLINKEIERVETIKTELVIKQDMDGYNNNTGELKVEEVREPRRSKEFVRQTSMYDIEVEPNVKLSEKVMIPVKKFPKFNFVGRLLGPKGFTFKRLQNGTGCKMSILGKGSMKDREKEKEFLESGEEKYSHLQDELHVLIEVEAPKAAAHGRLASAISEVQKFLVPDPHDPIRQEQMRELAYLNGADDGPATTAGPHAPTVIAAPISVRGRGRGRGVVRSVVRRAIPAHALQPSTVAAVGTPRHGATAPDPYAYHETYEPGYEYEHPAYQEGGATEVVYYRDYTHEAYPPTAGPMRLKAPLRSMKSAVRESQYPY